MSASDEEDDFYGAVPSKPETPTSTTSQLPASSSKAAGQDKPISLSGGANEDDEEQDEEEYDDEEDEDESDSDIEIITERPAIPTIGLPLDIKLPTRVPVTITAPSSQHHTQVQSPALTQASTSTKIEPPTKILPSKFGANLPEVRTSSVDVNRVPEWESVGKPITEIDIDADLAEQAKPWRMPGADQSDYFNYGFDEFTWTSYCLRQQAMAGILVEQKADAQKFEMMLNGGGMMNPGGMGPNHHGMGQPPGPHGHAHPGQQQGGPAGMMMPGGGMGPGMDEQVMHQMMANLMAQGVDPNDLNFDTFMQQMQQMQTGGMPPGMPGPIPGGMPGNMPGNMPPGMPGGPMQGAPGQGPPGMPSQGQAGGPQNMMQQQGGNQWGPNQNQNQNQNQKMRRW